GALVAADVGEEPRISRDGEGLHGQVLRIDRASPDVADGEADSVEGAVHREGTEDEARGGVAVRGGDEVALDSAGACLHSEPGGDDLRGRLGEGRDLDGSGTRDVGPVPGVEPLVAAPGELFGTEESHQSWSFRLFLLR